MKKNLNEPLVTLAEGDAPVQILEEEFKGRGIHCYSGRRNTQ